MNYDIYNRRWMSLFANPSNKIYAKTYNFLIKKYSEGHRKYHNFEHIISCLKHFDLVREKLTNPWNVEIAIWFHDVIYNILSKKNEIKSANAAIRFLNNLDTDQKTINIIFNLILATRHIEKPQVSDEKYIIDIDLAVLGSPHSEFLNYEYNIRKEYKIFPYSIYKKHRMIILNNFLQSDNIFLTDEFNKMYNNKARKNIQILLKEME